MSTKPAKSSRGPDNVTNEYVCIDRTRVPATDSRAITHDRRVRAVLAAADRLSLFVPTHIAQLLCDFSLDISVRNRIAAGIAHSVAVKEDGSLMRKPPLLEGFLPAIIRLATYDRLLC